MNDFDYFLTVNMTNDELDGDTSNVASLLNNSGGNGISLREAVIATNNTPGNNLIELQGGQTYTLSIAPTGNNDPPSRGDLDIDSNLTIKGLEEGATIDAQEIGRVFSIYTSATVTLDNLTITGGNEDYGGGGIANWGTLFLNNSIVSGNTSSDRGGGIFNVAGAELTLTDSVVSGNSASKNGGGIYNQSDIDDDSLIDEENHLLGNLTLTRSVVSENNAGGSGGGIATFAGVINITDSTIADNTAVNDGGGLHVAVSYYALRVDDQVTDITLTDSTISGNTAVNGSGGGIATENTGLFSGTDDAVNLLNTNISKNIAGADGGGIANGIEAVDREGIDVIVNVSSTVSNNQAGDDGGGISNIDGTMTVYASTIKGNTASSGGGGIHNDFNETIFKSKPFIVLSSTINDNTAGFGGGIYSARNSKIDLLNSTVSNNSAFGSGGAIYNSDSFVYVDPINSDNNWFVSGGTTNLVNSTVTQNTADSNNDGGGVGGGIANLTNENTEILFFSPGTVNARNSIIAGNFDNSPAGNNIHPNISGPVNGNNNNLIDNVAGAKGSIGTGSDIVDPNFQLGDLADNGGVTKTHALLPNSRAIDGGNNALIFNDRFDLDKDKNRNEAFPFDQRNLQRIFDGNDNGMATVDIGAFELQAVSLPTISIDDVSITEGNSGTKNATFTITLSAQSNQPVTVDYATANDTATAGVDYNSKNGEITFNAGQTSKQVNVQVQGDNDFEPDETFFLNLSNSSGATIADNQGVATISNDDDDDSGIIVGTKGEDSLTGTAGNDKMEGLKGNDVLMGEGGDDLLVGVDSQDQNPGANEKDTLIGGPGSDIFVLGSETQSFYNDGETGAGSESCANIEDFKSGVDTIILHGSSSDYELREDGGSTLIYEDGSEVIGKVISVTGLNLDSNDFLFL